MDGSGRAQGESVERIRLNPDRLAGPLGRLLPSRFFLAF